MKTMIFVLDTQQVLKYYNFAVEQKKQEGHKRSMAKTISIGAQDFARLRERDNFYVDKTNFIQEWWDNEDEVTLITRPRRFGKTLNLTMLDCFFSNKYAGRGDLFEGLSIWENERFRKLQGTYPVIFLSFATIKSSDYEDAVYGLKRQIRELYLDYSFLLSSEAIYDEEKEIFLPKKILDKQWN